MKNNPIIECKKVEDKGKKIIADTEKEVASMIVEANRRGQKRLAQVDDEVQKDIEVRQQKLKEQISDLAKQGKKDIASQIKTLEKIENKKIQEAAELVLKNII